jgi:glycerol-3-phosphate dehydrogenase
LRRAAREEFVVNLDDLLLRRSRIGLLEPEGARAALPQIKAICQPELGWSEAQWSVQEQRYLKLWREDHAPVRA